MTEITASCCFMAILTALHFTQSGFYAFVGQNCFIYASKRKFCHFFQRCTSGRVIKLAVDELPKCFVVGVSRTKKFTFVRHGNYLLSQSCPSTTLITLLITLSIVPTGRTAKRQREGKTKKRMTKVHHPLWSTWPRN